MVGRIVCSAAGRDRGRFMVIVGFCGKFPLVCDGKERRLKNPKRKNPKHLEFTDAFLPAERLNSDSSIRKNLRIYAEGTYLYQEEI